MRYSEPVFLFFRFLCFFLFLFLFALFLVFFIRVQADGDVLRMRLTDNMHVVTGSLPKSGEGGAVLTDALADKLLASSSYSHIKAYSDLIGMRVVDLSGSLGSSVFVDRPESEGGISIVGIVRSDARSIYLCDMDYASYVLENLAPSLQPISSRSSVYTGDLRKGEVVYMEEPSYDGEKGTESPQKGDPIRIMGKTFTVAMVYRNYTSAEEYAQYLADVTGSPMMTLEEYCQQHKEMSEWDAAYAWTFDYWSSSLRDFAQRLMNSPYVSPSVLCYAAAYHPDCLPAMLSFFDSKTQAQLPDFVDIQLLYAGRLYEKETGKHPSMEDANSYMETKGTDLYREIEQVSNTYMEEYNSFMDNYYADYRYNEYRVILNDADYVSLCSSVGSSDAASGVASLFQTYTIAGQTYFNNYMMFHTSDAEAAQAYLCAHYDRAQVFTYEDLYADAIGQYRIGIISNLFSMLLVTCLLCMCLFFVMRANFMSRVREVGILRAIGVSKRNIVYRFAVESTVVTLLTVMIGFFASSAFMFYVRNVPYIDRVFFFPFWLAAILFVLLFAASVFFGILPALALLRKTPSRILAKYDV